MFASIKRQKGKFLFSAVSRLLVFVLSFSLVFAPSAAQAQTIASLNLPVPGTMVGPSQAFVPVLLKGMTIHPDNPLQFEFIIDSGNTDFKEDQIKSESERLVKYFLASMTIPKDDLWVNLSPYEKNRIIPDELGKTELGRDMLAQDYILKQLTASLMYPEKELGKEFWDKVYRQAKEKYGTTEIPVDTFNKVWILPETAAVYEHGQTVYTVEAKLRVMLDEDYQAREASLVKSEAQDKSRYASRDTRYGSEIIREIILPAIEKEVNEGQNFAPLRQIYHSLILAKWYKETIKNSLLSKIYIDQKKIAGVESGDETLKDQIYAQYMEAYKKGVFNYIKEDYDRLSNETIPRKYFSGGFKGDVEIDRTASRAGIEESTVGKNYQLAMEVSPQKDGASSPILGEFFEKRKIRKMIIEKLEMPSKEYLISNQNITDATGFMSEGYDFSVTHHSEIFHIETKEGWIGPDESPSGYPAWGTTSVTVVDQPEEIEIVRDKKLDQSSSPIKGDTLIYTYVASWIGLSALGFFLSPVIGINQILGMTLGFLIIPVGSAIFSAFSPWTLSGARKELDGQYSQRKSQLIRAIKIIGNSNKWNEADVKRIKLQLDSYDINIRKEAVNAYINIGAPDSDLIRLVRDKLMNRVSNLQDKQKEDDFYVYSFLPKALDFFQDGFDFKIRYQKEIRVVSDMPYLVDIENNMGGWKATYSDGTIREGVSVDWGNPFGTPSGPYIDVTPEEFEIVRGKKLEQAILDYREKMTSDMEDQSSSPVTDREASAVKREAQQSSRYAPRDTSDEEVGGIDMNSIDLDKQGGGVDIQFDPAELQEIIDAGIDGFAPVIINITPLPSVLPLLGLQPPRKEDELEVSSLN